MSSVISELKSRLDALEAQVAALKTENELLKMATPLAAVTEGLRVASADQIQAWMDACNEIAAKYQGSVAAPTPAKKPAKEKRATTNTEGPKDWNVFVNSVQREMAAAAGVAVDELSEKELKEAAKKVGAGWQAALKEAAIRKRMEETGVDRSAAEMTLKEEKDAKKEKKAAKGEKAEKKPKAVAPTATPKKVSKKKAAEPTLEEQMAELGMSVREVDGVKYIVDDSSGEAFTVNEDGSFGDRVGIYDADAELIDTTA